MAGPASFESYRQAAAPPPAPAAAAAAADRLPFKAGAIFKAGLVREHLTPEDIAGLAKLGLGPGDPVPDNLAQVIAGYIAEAKAEGTYLPVPPGTPPLREPPTVAIDRLPAAKQAELRAFIAQGREQLAREAAALIPGASLGVNEAILAAMAAPEPAPPPAAPVSAHRPPPPPAADAGGDLTPTRCPRCSCDLAHYEEVEASAEDRHAYLAMILGGPEARFFKDVPLFGGNVGVVFRNLSAADGRLVMEQVRLDHLETPFVGELAFFARVTEYRLALALVRVEFRGVAGAAAVPAANATGPARPDDPPSTVRLATVVDYIRDALLASESLVRAVLEAFKEFQRLVEALEAKADSPDFWRGIAARR